jgi:tRNA-Thr(GGU) m(6)t(6)A37 methyltransferase TsaA
MRDTFTLRPIGVLSTPWKSPDACPRNGRQPNPPPACEALVFGEFVAGLLDLEGFSHLILLYWLHQVRAPEMPAPEMTVTPPFDGQPHGVFTTRSPARPNPIGLSVVAFDGFAAPDRLIVRYLDCLDGTPLLDIKPYLPSTDAEPEATMGWLAKHRTVRARQA